MTGDGTDIKQLKVKFQRRRRDPSATTVRVFIIAAPAVLGSYSSRVNERS